MIWDPFNAWPAGRRWLWGLLAVLVTVVQVADFIGLLRPSREVGVDFFRNWIAARYILDGVPIYTDQEAGIGRYLSYRPVPECPHVNKLTHPPPAAILALPFAWLDYPEATLAWNIVSLVTLAVSLWLIGRHLMIPFPSWGICPLMTLLLLCGPLRAQLHEGQFNLLLLLLLTGSWTAERSGRLWWAGGLVGVATAIKFFPGFVLLHFLMRREWKAFVAGVASFATITALTMLVVGPESYSTYIFDVLPILSQDRANWLNSSVIGFWSKLFDPGDGYAARFVIPLAHSRLVARLGIFLSVCGILAGWACSVWSARSTAENDRAFGLTLTTMLLLSPVTWDHYFLLLTLPITLIWLALPDSPWVKGWLLATLVALWFETSAVWRMLIPVTASDAWPIGIAAPVQTMTVFSYQFYALLSLFILDLVVARRGPGNRVSNGVVTAPSASVTSNRSGSGVELI